MSKYIENYSGTVIHYNFRVLSTYIYYIIAEFPYVEVYRSEYKKLKVEEGTQMPINTEGTCRSALDYCDELTIQMANMLIY